MREPSGVAIVRARAALPAAIVATYRFRPVEDFRQDLGGLEMPSSSSQRRCFISKVIVTSALRTGTVASFTYPPARNRVLDLIGHTAEEAAGRAAVAHAMVQRERQLGDLADGELAVDHPRLVDDPPVAEIPTSGG